jgi:hypothetical protein
MKGKRKGLRCGRRWGKNVFGETIACRDMLDGRLVGWFAPEHKRIAETLLPRFHPAQLRAYRMKGKRKGLRCGRRWGKNVFGKKIACQDMLTKWQAGGLVCP